MTKIFHIYTDGGARGNPGPAAIGFMLTDSNNQTVVKMGKYLGRTTNNVAEYLAVIESFKWIINNLQTKSTENIVLKFFSDSQLVVNQITGRYRVKDSKLKLLIIEVKKLEKQICGKIVYSLIPREKNFEADALVNQTLDNNG